MTRRMRPALLTATLALFVVGCNSDANGPNGGNGTSRSDVIVLNSVSRTILQFTIEGDALAPFGTAISLPANFDGNAMDVSQDLFVSTISSFGGSQVVWGSLSTGANVVTGFPSGAEANPGRPTLVLDIAGALGALVPARGDNAVYIAFPSQPNATLLAGEVGEFVERALPFGELLISVDANLDDEGGTFQPLGPPRLEYSLFITGAFFDEFDITGAVNATDIAFFGDDIGLLAGGSFAGPDFDPAGDGNLVLINADARAVDTTFPLNGNGLAIEGGRDGLAYVTRTRGAGTFESDVLSFSFSTGDWARGPDSPIRPKDADGSEITNCWATTALVDGRLLCIIFDGVAPGRIVLMGPNGDFLDDAPVGVGAVDLHVR